MCVCRLIPSFIGSNGKHNVSLGGWYNAKSGAVTSDYLITARGPLSAPGKLGGVPVLSGPGLSVINTAHLTHLVLCVLRLSRSINGQNCGDCTPGPAINQNIREYTINGTQ